MVAPCRVALVLGRLERWSSGSGRHWRSCHGGLTFNLLQVLAVPADIVVLGVVIDPVVIGSTVTYDVLHSRVNAARILKNKPRVLSSCIPIPFLKGHNLLSLIRS